MNSARYILLFTFTICIISCGTIDDHQFEDASLELREDPVVAVEVIYGMVSGIGGFSEVGTADCTTGHACFTGGGGIKTDEVIIAKGIIEEELIIEAIAKNLCLVKFTKLRNGTLRTDLIASPDLFEREMQSIKAPRNHFAIGNNGSFKKVMDILKIDAKGLKKGEYRVSKQSFRYWSGYTVFTHKDFY